MNIPSSSPKLAWPSGKALDLYLKVHQAITGSIPVVSIGLSFLIFRLIRPLPIIRLSLLYWKATSIFFITTLVVVEHSCGVSRVYSPPTNDPRSEGMRMSFYNYMH